MSHENSEYDLKKAAIDDLRIDASVAFYESVMSERIDGPQLEGFTPDWLRDALRDPSTRTIDMGSGVDWPLLSLIAHNQDYRAGFFEDHFPGKPAYYLSLPPENDGNDAALQAVASAVASLEPEQGLLVYDTHSKEAGDPYFDTIQVAARLGGMACNDVTPITSAFGRSYGAPKVTHFEAVARHDGKWALGDCNTTAAFARLVAKGERLPLPESGATVLTRALLEENNGKALDEIWRIYSDQFDELVDDHPSLQIQPREELERMLLDEGSFNVAYMEGGEVVSLVYFVSNIDKCVWLNADFFNKERDTTPGIMLAYFPGIVVAKDKAQQGAGYVDGMIKLIEDVYEEAGTLGMQIFFQCTNVSETYIPKIVTSAISGNGVFAFDKKTDETGSSFRKTAEYEYRILDVNQIQ